MAELERGELTLFASDGEPPQARSGTLAALVDGPPSVIHVLNSFHIAGDLAEALRRRSELGVGECLVTPDGLRVGRGWISLQRGADAGAGVLAREHDMRRLKAEMRELQARLESAVRLLRDGRVRTSQLEERREKLQQDATSLLNEYSEIKGSLESAKYRMDQANARKAALVEEASEIDGEKFTAEEQLRESRLKHGQAAESLESLAAEKASLEAQRDDLRSELQRVRAQAEEDRQTVQNITIQFESRRTSKESAAQNLERMQRQLQQFKLRETEIRGQLESSETPLADNKAELERIEHRARRGRPRIDEPHALDAGLHAVRVGEHHVVEDVRRASRFARREGDAPGVRAVEMKVGERLVRRGRRALRRARGDEGGGGLRRPRPHPLCPLQVVGQALERCGQVEALVPAEVGDCRGEGEAGARGREARGETANRGKTRCETGAGKEARCEAGRGRKGGRCGENRPQK